MTDVNPQLAVYEDPDSVRLADVVMDLVDLTASTWTVRLDRLAPQWLERFKPAAPDLQRVLRLWSAQGIVAVDDEAVTILDKDAIGMAADNTSSIAKWDGTLLEPDQIEVRPRVPVHLEIAQARRNGAPPFPRLMAGLVTDQSVSRGATVQQIGIVTDQVREGFPTMGLVVMLPDGTKILAETPARSFVATCVSMVFTDPRLSKFDPAEPARKRYQDLSTVLSHLDRCVHGRHEGDVCAGGCRGGYSVGNLWLFTGVQIGHDLYGRPLWMPRRAHRSDPQAWSTPQTEPDGPEMPDNDIHLLGSMEPPLLPMYRQMGMRFFWVDNQIQVWSSGALVGRRRFWADRTPIGPYEIIVNELTDEELAARDRERDEGAVS